MKTKRILFSFVFLLAGHAGAAGKTAKSTHASNTITPITIESLNQQIKASGANWTTKDTWVSHLSQGELQHLFGLNQALSPEVEFVAPQSRHARAGVPTVLDWRNKDGKNWVSPLINQANCGSCVAFASIGVMETQFRIASGLSDFNISLSPQNLFACGGGSCEMGWWPSSAAEFLEHTGVVDEACQPYTSGATGMDVSCQAACADADHRRYKISSYTTPTQWMKDIDAVKAALQKGSVVTTLTVYADFLWYAGGIYKHVTGSALGGHAVSIVGYDDTSRSFIIRNNWGPEWGEGGFAHISYDDISGIGNQTWLFDVPSGAGSISVQSPRDYTYVAQTLPVKALANFAGTDSLTITVFDANGQPVYNGSCAADCSANVDVTGLADGRYEIEAMAMNAAGQVIGTSPHQAFYVANTQPTLNLSFKGKGVDLGTTLKDRIEFDISAVSSSVPMSSIDFHYKDSNGHDNVKSATITLAQMTMGWRTNVVPSGAYEIWMVGHVKTNQYDDVVETPHLNVKTQN